MVSYKETVLGLFTLFAPLCGLCYPDLESIVRWPKLTIPLLRMLSGITTLFYIFFSGDTIVFLVQRSNGGTFVSIVETYILLCFPIMVFIKLYLTFRNRKDFLEMQEFFKQKRANEQFQEIHNHRDATTTKLGLLMFFFNCVVVQITHTGVVIMNRREALPSSLPGDRNNVWVVVGLIIYQQIAAFLNNGMTAVFEWLRITMMSKTSAEFMILRDELTNIFSKALNNEGDENANGFAVNQTDKSRMYDDLDRELNDWIGRHVRTLKLAKSLVTTFGFISALSHQHVLVLTFTFILDFKSNRCFMYYAFMQVILLYANCYYGTELTTKAEEICSDVIGLDWNRCPLKVKKKLLTILTVVKGNPVKIQFRGTQELSLARFLDVMTLSYSLTSFLFGLV